MSVSWRGIDPSTWIFDELVGYNTTGYLRPVEPVPTMAEINEMLLRFNTQRKRNLPSTDEVAEMLEQRLAATEERLAREDRLKRHVLESFGIQERQIAVVPRTYQERKQRRKKAS